MKRIIAAIAISFSLFGLSAEMYEMPLIGLSIEIPDDYYVKGEANPLAKELVSEAFSDNSEISNYVENGVSTCLVAKAPYNSLVLTIGAAYSPTVTENLRPSNTEIEDDIESSLTMLDMISGELIKKGKYDTEFATFPYSEIRIPDIGLYFLSYTLRLDNYIVTFSFVQSSPFEATSLETVESMMDSVGKSNSSTIPTKIISQQYTDGLTGTSFEIPYDCELFESSDGYCSFGNWADGVLYTYVSGDVYSNLPSYAKSFLSRKDINNSAFTEMDIAAAIGVPRKMVSKRRINGIEYFAVQVHASDFPGQTIVDCLMYERYVNGYEIGFIYADSNDPWNYEAFDEFIRTVDYK